MFSKDLEHTIGQCYREARDARHEFMTVEHLLLALLDNPSAIEALRASGAQLTRLVEELPEIVELAFNPVKALAPGQGCLILDARIRLENQG